MNLGFRHLVPSAVTAAAVLYLSGSAAGSPLVEKVFLFSEYSVSRFPGPSSVTIEGIAGAQLGMDSTAPKVTTVTEWNSLGGTQTFSFDAKPTYAGHTGFVDSLRRELPSDFAAHIAAEISEVDDQGANDQGDILPRDEGRRPNNDAGLNIDFYRKGDSLTLAIPDGAAWTQLVLVEDAGVDWMRLEHCAEASCSNATTFFDGFGTDAKAQRSLRDQLTGLPRFSRKDNTEALDQAWVFLLSEPLQGFFRVTYVGNWAGQGLELDFVSGTSQRLRPRAVPGPNPLLLLGMGLAALYLVRRQGRSVSWVLRTGTSL